MDNEELIPIDKGGASLKVTHVTTEFVFVHIYVRDMERTWLEFRAKIPREKFKEIGHGKRTG